MASLLETLIRSGQYGVVLEETEDRMAILKPLQFSLRFVFALTALSVGQVVLMRLLPQWHLWFLLYVFVVGLCLGIAFSKERGGPGSLFHNLLWTSVAVAVASMVSAHHGHD